MHPDKAHQSIAPSAFEFRFARSSPPLGPEAQKIMDDLRGEALRIKAQLVAEREDGNDNLSFTRPQARRIATPKGKVGRFSGAHMAEFKKMDSIAGHPSAFRAQPERFRSVDKSLKRSQSAAKLSDREIQSKFCDTKITLENTTPTKRVRVSNNPDERQTFLPKPIATPPSHSRSVLASITTPTQASLARANSVKRQPHVPTLSPSISRRNLYMPQRLTKSATTSRIDTMQTTIRTPSKFDRVKSILHRPVTNSDKTKSTIPTTPLSQSSTKADLNKDLPSVPTTPAAPSAKGDKHVSFSPIIVSRSISTTLNSPPSPSKSRVTRSESITNLGSVLYPSLGGVEKIPGEIKYPTLDVSRLLPKLPQEAKVKSPPPSLPGSFTFRSDNTINFSTTHKEFGSSPGQASVRQVRPSIFPGSAPGSFKSPNKGNIGGSQVGILNKKRHRASLDEDNEENQIQGSPPKKFKRSAPETAKSMTQKVEAEKMASKTKIPSPVKKGILTLNRLNMLARPKLRK